MLIAKISEPSFKNRPKIIDEPKINWHKITKINEKAGNGTSFIVTICVYSGNESTLDMPGTKKYKPITTLPVR